VRAELAGRRGAGRAAAAAPLQACTARTLLALSAAPRTMTLASNLFSICKRARRYRLFKKVICCARASSLSRLMSVGSFLAWQGAHSCRRPSHTMCFACYQPRLCSVSQLRHLAYKHECCAVRLKRSLADTLSGDPLAWRPQVLSCLGTLTMRPDHVADKHRRQLYWLKARACRSL